MFVTSLALPGSCFKSNTVWSSPCSILAPLVTQLHLEAQNIFCPPQILSVFANLSQIPPCRLILIPIRCMCARCSLCRPPVFTHSYAWPPVCLCLRVQLCNSPSQHYEEIQTVPRVSKVTLLAKNPQSHHLDHHLDGKERKDEVIKVLHRHTETEMLWCN